MPREDLLGRWQRGKSQSKGTQNDVGYFQVYLALLADPTSIESEFAKYASKCGKTFRNTNLPAGCPAFLTELHQLTNKDYFKVSQARYTWNAYFGQTNKEYIGEGSEEWLFPQALA